MKLKSQRAARLIPAYFVIVLLLYVASLPLNMEAFADVLAQVVQFDIKPATLDRALLQFADQAHVQVAFESMRGLQKVHSTELKGPYSARQALADLLTGSHFSFRVHGNTVTIVPSGTQASDHDAPAVKAGRTQEGPSADQPGAPAEGSSAAKRSKPRPQPIALQEIIVTGTHIAGVRPISPIITVTAADIANSGLPDVASAIRALPQTFGGGENPGVIVAGGINSGEGPLQESTANLRGMGPGYTLTLLDGHRLASVGSTDSADLSAIPTAAVQRVEIQTGGASAIYGADAVAGVVNVILRKNYSGATTDAYVGGTADGGLEQRYSQLVGHTFQHGDAGVMLGYQFQSQDEINASQRAVSRLAGSYNLQPQEKSHAAFLSAHMDEGPDVSTHLEGIYNHRTSLDRGQLTSAAIAEQALENQFALDGGVKFRFPRNRTLAMDVTWSGDSSSSTQYEVAPPLLSTTADQDRLLEVSAAAQGRIVRLPWGSVMRGAVGTGVRKTYMDSQSIKWDRRVEHAYAEINLPMIPSADQRPGLERLTLSAAARFEHYSDFGAITEPKVSLAWSPTADFTVSTTWGKSFKPPTLLQLHLGQAVVRYPGSLFGFPPGGEVLLVEGSNQGLKPQTSDAFTGSIEWRPQLNVLHGIAVGVTYYEISFSDGVNVPIYFLNYPEVSGNPLYAPFVVRNPSAALQDSVIADSIASYNFFGLPVSPQDVAALVLDRYDNISQQVIHGIDGHLSFQRTTELGEFLLEGNASWESFDQELLVGGPLQAVSGTIFNPPSVKARVMGTWNLKRFGISLFANYVSGEVNTASVPHSQVPSWTTFDGQMRYAVHDVELRLSVQNMFDRAPPSIPAGATVPFGVGFDPNNYSALGRFASLEVSTTW